MNLFREKKFLVTVVVCMLGLGLDACCALQPVIMQSSLTSHLSYIFFYSVVHVPNMSIRSFALFSSHPAVLHPSTLGC